MSQEPELRIVLIPVINNHEAEFFRNKDEEAVAPLQAEEIYQFFPQDLESLTLISQKWLALLAVA